jgi:hypothetical protein
VTLALETAPGRVSMAAIDAARGRANECITKLRRVRTMPAPPAAWIQMAEHELATARAEVEELLGAWWRQGCRP